MLETLVLNVRAALTGLKYLRQANEINKERINDLIDKIRGHEKYDEESAAEIERLSDKIVVLMDGDNVGAMRCLRDRFDAAKAKAKQEEQKLMNKVTEEREEIELTQKEAERQRTLVASLQHQLEQTVSRREPLEGTVFRRRLGCCILCSTTLK
jgi:ABC-type molybdate transport system ATPase subunit